MIIAATGHRPQKLGGYSRKIEERLTLFAHLVLNEMKPDLIISGMALGWDQAVVLAARRLDIPFIAAVPFKGYESRWPDHARRTFDVLLTQAAEVEYVCAEGYAAWKNQQRNEWMVDRAHKMLALWDGTPSGTAHCVAYAEQCEKPVINVWDRWRNFA